MRFVVDIYDHFIAADDALAHACVFMFYHDIKRDESCLSYQNNTLKLISVLLAAVSS